MMLCRTVSVLITTLSISYFGVVNATQAFPSSPNSSEQSVLENTLHLDWMNKNIAPGQNFYGYANGLWQQENPIPNVYSSWSNFQVLQETTEKNLNKMMQGLAQNKQLKPGSVDQKIGDFYFSGMNLKAINQQGYAPLKPLLTQISSLATLEELEALVPKLHLMGVNVLFSFGGQQDFKNSQSMIAAGMQGGLGLPDRDYYCSDEEKFVKIRELYLNHMAAVFLLLGDTKAQAVQNAKTVMQIETALAKASLTQIEQRDPYTIYHKMPLDTLATLTPHFAWKPYLEGLGLNSIKEINVGMPDFFKALDNLLVKIQLSDWKVYIRWHVLDTFAVYLSDPFVNEEFNLSKGMTGVKALRPRWQRVVNTVNNELDFAVGQYYVEHYFSQESKKQVQIMMDTIRQEFRKVLQNQPWMMPETKKAALQKLDKMTQRVGYPDKWRDYSGLMIDRGPYVLNVVRANEFNSHYELDKIGKPVDRNEWHMSPQSINAYYDPSMNSINILAGILQAPFFDAQAPAAVNYGSIGFVIGHEMTHGFDDKGALFDGGGNLKNWWTKEDKKQFKAATDCIAKQFSSYRVNGNIPVKGDLVVGEATADLGGVLLAYEAFHASKEYATAKTINGFTPDQQFFLSAAHTWAGNIRPELARQLITVDPHPPKESRVNGTMANIAAFQRAFGLKKPSPMIQDPRCQIW